MKTITKWSGPKVKIKSLSQAAHSLKCLFKLLQDFYNKTAVNGGASIEEILNAKYLFMVIQLLQKKKKVN